MLFKYIWFLYNAFRTITQIVKLFFKLELDVN